MNAAPAAMYFPREEYEARWGRVYDAMAERGHEIVIVWQRSAGTYDRAGNVYWLTNYMATGTGQDPADEMFGAGYTFAAVVFRAGTEPELHIGQPRDETDTSRLAYGRLVVHETDLIGGIARHLRVEGIEGRVTVVGDDILPGIYDRLLRRLSPQIEWSADEELLIGPQQVKSPRELEAYRTGGAIVTDALSAAMEALVAGNSGAEAAARAAAIVVRAGGGYHRIDATHGPRSEHFLLGNDFYGYDTSLPAKGDMVRAWVYGPIFQGYWMDPGRTAICGGKPSAEQRAVLEGAAQIVDGIVDAIRPGATARELGIIGERIARTVGYHEHRQHVPLFGHGLGTFFVHHIIPVGDPGPDEGGLMRYDEPLKPGMVVAAEAFLRHPGVGMAGFEQNLIVTEDGAELLTRTPMRYW